MDRVAQCVGASQRRLLLHCSPTEVWTLKFSSKETSLQWREVRGMCSFLCVKEVPPNKDILTFMGNGEWLN